MPQCSITWREFCNKKLNLPGTRVEVEWTDRQDKKEKRETFLIGDINTLGGVCDDCMAFSYDDAQVVSYTPA